MQHTCNPGNTQIWIAEIRLFEAGELSVELRQQTVPWS
jgi:hypothetical protein